MKCNKVKKLLSPYIDKQLSNKEEQLVEEHLKICPKCRHELEELNQLVASLKKMNSHSAPQEIMVKVNQYIESKKATRWSFLFKPFPVKLSPVLNYVALAFAVLLVALSVSYLYLRIQPFQKTEVAQKAPATLQDEEADQALSQEGIPGKIQKMAEKKSAPSLAQEPKRLGEASRDEPAITGEEPAPETEIQRGLEREKGTKDLKQKKEQVQLKASAKPSDTKDKKETAALPQPLVVASAKKTALVEGKETAPPAEKEDYARKRTYRAKEAAKTLDELVAVPIDCNPDIPGAPGSVENPILSQTDPLLEIAERIEPTLPENEVEKLKENIIVFELTVDAEGNPIKIEIMKGSGNEAIDGAVINAIKLWKFKPLLCGNKPAAVKGKLTYKISRP